MAQATVSPMAGGLKIAQVSPYDFPYPGGVTEHIAHLAAQLQRLGHEVHVIAPSSADPATLGDLPRLHRIGRVVPVPANGSVARITLSIRGYRQVKHLLQREQFDVIHLHEPMVPALPLTVLRHSKATNVGTFHAYRKSDLALYYARPVLRPFFARLHGLIAVSEPAREFISEHFPGDYRIIPNGIDYARFSSAVQPLPQFADGRLNVLFVGRLEKRKGIKYLLRAWATVRRECPSARLIVVGGGPGLASYRAFVAAQGWSDVHLVGYVSSAELPRYYRSADVFCAPSTGQESFGVVLLEAMAAGRPIVASSIPGYREVVPDGEAGLLVPPKDEAALAARLLLLLRDPDLRRRMGAAGCRTARRYDWPRIAEQIVDLYRECIARRAAEPSPPGAFERVRRVAAEAGHLIMPRR